MLSVRPLDSDFLSEIRQRARVDSTNRAQTVPVGVSEWSVKTPAVSSLRTPRHRRILDVEKRLVCDTRDDGADDRSKPEQPELLKRPATDEYPD
jgi:hypothetical protein